MRAASGSREPRISAITSSRLSSAISRPSRTWARSSARRSSYFVRRTIDLALVVDVVAEHLAQRQRARHVVDQRDHVDAERRLQRRVLVELVEHDLRDRVALELDHDPHAAAVGLVAQVGDLGDLLLLDEVR